MIENGKIFIAGIDTGANGGIAVLDISGSVVGVHKFTNLTHVELVNLVYNIAFASNAVYIEKVHAMPALRTKNGKESKQGISSTWKFSGNYHIVLGGIYASNAIINHVTPQQWQKQMQCLTKGNKNVSKQRAQELFPNIKITHAVADALLIAEFGRQDWLQRNGKIKEN